MSRVSNIILCIEGIDFDADRKCREIHAFFASDDIRGFVSVDDEALPKRWYGGTKYLEADLYIGAFNHIDIEALISHIQGIEWQGPTSVQLMVKEQEESLFKSVVVIEKG